MVWTPVIEDDDDEDNPWVWSAEINSAKYGTYVFISNTDENRYEITATNCGSCEEPIKVCKSLASAKRWVAMNIR